MSEITFVHYDDLQHFINFDETHHPFNSSGDKGGPREGILSNPNLPNHGNRVAKDSGTHTTGIYTTNPFVPLPPIFIFDANAKEQD